MGLGDIIVDGVKTLGGLVFGGGDNPGILGTGQYQVDPYQISSRAGTIAGADGMRANAHNLAMGARNRQAATMQAAQIDGSQQNQFRDQQQSLAQALMAQANGQGPSLAQGQLKQATDRNLAQALALQNSQRGAGSASALRNLAFQRAAMGQQAAADSSQLALTEQMQARNQLGQVLAGARGQDMDFAFQQAGFNQQANANNLQADMQQRSLNDAMTQRFMQMGFDVASAQQQAALQLEQLRVNQNLGYNQIQSGAYAGSARSWQNLLQMAASGAANVPVGSKPPAAAP